MNYQYGYEPVLMSGEPDRDGGGSGTDVVTRTQARVKKPSMYKVILLNDDYTPMDFVILLINQQSLPA